MKIERALIVRKPWARMIVDGIKTWELRKTYCSVRGRVGIIEAGSKTIIGEVDMVDCWGITAKSKLLPTNYDLHHVSEEQIRDYGVKYLWVFESARLYEKPMPYKHLKGAQVWVKIN